MVFENREKNKKFILAEKTQNEASNRLRVVNKFRIFLNLERISGFLCKSFHPLLSPLNSYIPKWILSCYKIAKISTVSAISKFHYFFLFIFGNFYNRFRLNIAFTRTSSFKLLFLFYKIKFHSCNHFVNKRL